MSDDNPNQRRRKHGDSVTIMDVAKHAGVSPQTVSRSLGRPELVNKKTRQVVLKAVKELHYIPNAAARDLASSSSRAVAIVIPTLSSPIYATQVSSTIKLLEQHGIWVMIGDTEYSLEREESVVGSLLQRRPQGIVITGAHHTDRTTQMLRDSGIPVIQTWDTEADFIDYAIGFSNRAVGRDVARLLLSRGSKRIAYVGGRFDIDPRGRRRFEGLAEVLAEAGLEPSAAITFEMPMTAEDGGRSLDLVFEKAPLTDAIFFSTDQLALSAVLECNRRGIRVPDQLAICGFGNYDLSALVMPALTTVHVQTDKIGKLTAELLLSTLNNEPPSEKKIVVDHRIVRRGSA